MPDPTHETESSDSDEHFSDAHSGLGDSGTTSPVRPLTKLPKVEPHPSKPDLPKTHINEAQRSDAEPEEGAIIPASDSPESHADSKILTPSSPVGERDESSSIQGAISEATTPEQRFENTMRDIADESSARHVQADFAHSEKTNENYFAEEAKDAPGPLSSPGIKSSATRARRTSSSASRGAMREKTNDIEDDEGAFGDDFDDFEEGEEAADFDDFEGGFQEAEPPAQVQPTPTFAYPVLDFSTLSSTSAIFAATDPYLDTLFPQSALPQSPPPSHASSSAPTFLTSRSASLWSQLVAPPPLQPPNWIRSRIRRLFLISLGVPIDLDEILPASKQKKLILPSTPISPRTSTSLSRLKASDGNTSSTSLDSQGNSRTSRTGRRKAPPPASGLDLVSARQLCNVTDIAREGFTDEELRDHGKKLEALKIAANEALEYWVKKTDELIGDREAFEGVIENLVKHARKVRK